MKLNKIYNEDCIDGMKKLPQNSIDLVVTSPPYNVGIDYDKYNDDIPIDDYFKWTEEWLKEVYRILKTDGRIALNVPIEINIKERGGRFFMSSEIWQIMKKVGFNFFGLVELEEDSPHRVRQTAWGSWMSPSGPYIYNPKESVILAYKDTHIKQSKGDSEWRGQIVDVIDKNGKSRKKTIHSEKDKKEFMELVFGRWKYSADKQSLTKATFSLDIPLKAIKILTYKDDVILDPFMGSGTTALASEMLERNWIGFEISPNYRRIAKKRIKEYRDSISQLELFNENY